MADGGQNFFLICMTILPENYSLELDSDADDSNLEEDFNMSMKKRTIYSKGGSIVKVVVLLEKVN